MLPVVGLGAEVEEPLLTGATILARMSLRAFSACEPSADEAVIATHVC
jgi:hypothetical protein